MTCDSKADINLNKICSQLEKANNNIGLSMILLCMTQYDENIETILKNTLILHKSIVRLTQDDKNYSSVIDLRQAVRDLFKLIYYVLRDDSNAKKDIYSELSHIDKEQKRIKKILKTESEKLKFLDDLCDDI